MHLRETGHPKRFARRAILACVLALAPCACESAQRDPSKSEPALPIASTQPAPVAAAPTPTGKPNEVANAATRIAWSGLSRVNRGDPKRTTLDIRVDSLDAAGAVATASGQFRIVVHAEGADPAMLAFDLPVSCVAEQERHFDTLLDQYVLRVEPLWKQPPVAGTRLAVSVSVTTVLGTVLSTEGSMRW